MAAMIPPNPKINPRECIAFNTVVISAKKAMAKPTLTSEAIKITIESIADRRHQMHHCLKRNACANKRYKEKRNALAVSVIKTERIVSENKCGAKIKTEYAPTTMK